MFTELEIENAKYRVLLKRQIRKNYPHFSTFYNINNLSTVMLESLN